jgi:hypothetical protein
MFGYVIQLRDTLLVMGIICIIIYSVVLFQKLASPPNTNWSRGYDALLLFSTWMFLLPGVVFLAFYIFFRARVKHSAAKIASASKTLRFKKNAELNSVT